MELILIAIATGLMMLGLIAAGELIVRALRPQTKKPVDYSGLANGLVGVEVHDVDPHVSEGLGNLLHFIGHLFHH